MFTGSWLEGVTSIEQLYERIKGISPNEALMRLFNILEPFEGHIPDGSGKELAVSKFYGEYFDFDLFASSKNDKSKLNEDIGASTLGSMTIAQLHSELEAAKNQIEILERQKTDWMIEIKELQTRIATTEFEKKEVDEKVKRCMDIEQKFVRQSFWE